MIVICFFTILPSKFWPIPTCPGRNLLTLAWPKSGLWPDGSPYRWSTKLYHQESTSTMEQCAALCRLNILSGNTCNMFSWVSMTCYIGNHEKTTSSNISPPLGDIYITPSTSIKFHTFCAILNGFLLLQLRFPQKYQIILLWKMLRLLSSQGTVLQIWHIPGILVRKYKLYFFRFFVEGYDSTTTASLETCVADYYFHSLVTTAVFADDTTNKCWFGVSSTTTGNIVVSASSWTVYVKLGEFLRILSHWHMTLHYPFHFSICSNYWWGLHNNAYP